MGLQQERMHARPAQGLILHTNWDPNLFPTSLQHSLRSTRKNPYCTLSKTPVSLCFCLDPAPSQCSESLHGLNSWNRLENRQLLVQLQSPESYS